MTDKKSAGRRAWNATMKALMIIGAVLTITILVFVIGYIFYRGIPHLTWQLV